MVRRHAMIGFVAGVLFIPACKGADKGPEPVAAAPPAPNVITVHARDYAFEAPDTVVAGLTTIRLINGGPGFHHAMLFRLDSGRTVADVAAVLKTPGPMPAWFVPSGGPNAVAPGDSTAVTQDLAPGNYLWACFVDVPDHVPHVAKGMMRSLTVVPSSTPSAPPPTADINVILHDYGFEFSTPITAGRHTFKVDVAPGQPHEMVLIRLAPGKTMDDLMKYFDKPDGPPPAQPLGGTGDLMAGQSVYFTAEFTPGDYVMVCFMPDARDGKPHVAHGMVQTIHIS